MTTMNYADKNVWDLLSEGYNRGVFQCESRLFKKYLKQIQPQNLWELSAVIAGLRPGSLAAGYADQYSICKHDPSKIKSFDNPIIDNIFSSTNGVMLYQESLMSLGERLAWPHLERNKCLVMVDKLRKGVGKKDQAKLLEIGKEFVAGCETNKVDPELAKKLFEIIKGCGRYLFNLSHSMQYADVAYESAYLKWHHPLEFFATYLSYADEKDEKFEEISDLVNEARTLGIDILPPNVNSKNVEFAIEGDSVRYGLRHIKHFGGNTWPILEKLPMVNDWRQIIYLCFTDAFGESLRSKAAEAMIVTGCFADTKVSRRTLINLYNVVNKLTERELTAFVAGLEKTPDITAVPALLQEICDTITTKARKVKLSSQIKILDLNVYDDPSWIQKNEREYLGVPLTITSAEMSGDLYERCIACIGDFQKGDKKVISAVIGDVIATITKKGKNPGQSMARIKVFDSTGEIENLPIFPELFAEVSDILIPNTPVIISLYYGNTGWVVDNIRMTDE